jgi:hypothetical protein
LTGGLAEAVDRQEFFRNSGLNQIIKEVAGEQGIELANATAAQQVDILQEALKRKVPDSLIQRAQGSVQAQLSAFTDTLFAKRTGIFGVQRDLDKTAPGVQSVYTEFSRTITLFFGDSGTLAETGRLLSKILPPYDIMQDVRSAFQGINTGLESVNEVLRSLNKLFDDIAKSPLGQLVSAIDSKIPKPGDTLFQGSQVVQGNATGGYQIGPSIDLKQAPIVGGFFQATSKFFSDLFGTNAQPRFAGSLSDSFSMPLISAIATERANMPPGAEVVIANSSETVLTPAQMQTLSSAAGKGYEGRGGVTVKNLNIYQQPGEDARSLARRVLEELDLMVSEERSLRI